MHRASIGAIMLDKNGFALIPKSTLENIRRKPVSKAHWHLG